MASAITIGILGGCVAVGVLLFVVLLALSMLRPPHQQRVLNVIGAVLAALLIVTCPVVAYPAMLDLACDDYDWFGADAARGLRDQVWEAHRAIDVATSDPRST